jgi:hypothetical protein
MKEFFYDCEIIKAIPNPGEANIPGIQYCKGWQDYENMGVSVIGYWFEDEFGFQNLDIPLYFQAQRKEKLQDMVDSAERIVGFNSLAFDDKLLKANGVNVETTYDLLCEVRIASGQPPHFTKGETRAGYSLNALAKANLDYCKTGDGANAAILWQQGRHQEVIDYCINDVRILKDLYDKRKELIDPTNGQLLVCRD